MTNPTPLTPNELKALAYFAVGVTSEGSLGGRDVSYRLSFAGNVGRDGLMDPVGNSGYSFGTLQVDIGQHPDVAPRLLDAYQAWAAKQPDRSALELNRAQYQATLTALQRDGHAMEDAGARDIDRGRINRFLASNDGRAFVHGLDAQHVNGVTAVDARLRNGDSALERLERTALYRNAGDEEQARLAAMFMKLQNQSGQRYAPGLLARVEAGELASAADVKGAIDALKRNPAHGGADYIQSGADNTLRGTALFNSLRSASPDNPVAQAWAAVAANPLVGPVAAHADARRPALGPQVDAIRSLFLTPEASRRMVQALDGGRTLAEGDPALHNGRRRAGFFVSGHDFVHWNANGQGVACIAGQWRNVDPDHLRRTAQRDGSIEIALVENGRSTTLLHVSPHERSHAQTAEHSASVERAAPRAPRSAEAAGDDASQSAPSAGRPPGPEHHGVREAQTALAHLGYTGLDGRLLKADGALGRNSHHALEQFQRDQRLPPTGRLDERTQRRLTAMEQTMASSTHPANALYRQSLSAVQELDRQMGIPGSAHTVALAGVAAAEAARSGLTRVDRIEIAADRVHVQAVQFTGGADHWITNMTSGPIEVAQAVRQPLEVSSRQAAQVAGAQSFGQQQIAHDHAPMRTSVL